MATFTQGITMNGSCDDAHLFAGAEVQFYNYVYSFISSMSLKCAIQLGIPDIIHNHGSNKPITLSNLVDALSLPSSKTEYVHRLMRFLVHIGCFAYVDQEGYLLTPLSRLLLKDAKNNMSPFLLCMLDPDMISPWHFISTWFRESSTSTITNETMPFKLANGMDAWKYFEKNSELGKLVNEAMACDTISVMNSLIHDPEVQIVFNKNLTTLIDVGGGTGAAARSIAEAYPHLKCSVLDLPHVVSEAPRDISNNVIEYIGGDMFEFIPHADIIFFKFTLHDWSDESCLKVLRKCREAILPSKEKGGKVIIVETALEDKKEDHERTKAQLYLDMLMMVDTTGKERNEKEWETLFLKSGFTHFKITPLVGVKSLIEVYP